MLPQRVGLITSPRGAAVRDIVLILRRRFPNLHLILYPVRVQGEGSAGEIVAAIKYMNRKQLVDVVILARGGGSLEDLWAFNEETVVRAISACTIPIISGIGHETDFTIADFVADVRASTPSAAAELVVRSRLEFDRHIADIQHKLARQIRYLLLDARHHLRELGMDRALREVEDVLRRNRQHTDEIVGQLTDSLRMRLERLHRRFTVAGTRLSSVDLRARLRALIGRLEHRSAGLGVRIERSLGAKRQQIDRLRVQLEERSPLRVLERGYAICYDVAGNVVRAADDVNAGDEIRVQLSRGKLGARILNRESE